MKNYNDESMTTIVENMLNDSISRNNTLFNFLKIISNINNNEIIAINGGWGTGKTFFVKQIELLINFINNIDKDGNYINKELETNKLKCISELSQEQKESINTYLEKNNKKIRSYYEGNQTNCLYFNAWEYDNDESPILSIIYKIINDFPYLSTKIIEEKKDIFLSICDTISTFTTKGIIKISDYKNHNDLIEKIVTTEELKEKINQIFNDLLAENSNKLVIIIDELDRCRPTYSLKLLEEIKHYITSKDIIVILATNIHQLSNTIKNIYGYNFDVDEYLDKIIDLTISLKPIDKYSYVTSLGLESFNQSTNWFTESIMAYINYRKLEMRSINRFIRLMSFYENYIYLSGKKRRRTRELFEFVFLPYCLGEQIFNSNNYDDFVKGRGFEEFYNYISSSETIKTIVNDCIYCSTRKELRNVEEDMRKLYNAIYNQKEGQTSLKIGNEYFEISDIKYLLDLCSILNDFIKKQERF